MNLTLVYALTKTIRVRREYSPCPRGRPSPRTDLPVDPASTCSALQSRQSDVVRVAAGGRNCL